MQEYFDILQKCPLFDGIGRRDMGPMLACLGASVKFYPKKRTVIRPGRPAKYIGVVLKGRVQIEQVDYSGRRSIMGVCRPGDIFAESFACAGLAAMPVSVLAAEDSLIMPVDSMRAINTCDSSCDFHRRLVYNLMKILAAKNLKFHQKLDILSRRTTRDKLLAYLSYMAAEAGADSFYIPYSRQELADYLEVDRSGLSVQISRLEKEGVIRAQKNFFTLFPHESTM